MVTDGLCGVARCSRGYPAGEREREGGRRARCWRAGRGRDSAPILRAAEAVHIGTEKEAPIFRSRPAGISIRDFRAEKITRGDTPHAGGSDAYEESLKGRADLFFLSVSPPLFSFDGFCILLWSRESSKQGPVSRPTRMRWSHLLDDSWLWRRNVRVIVLAAVNEGQGHNEITGEVFRRERRGLLFQPENFMPAEREASCLAREGNHGGCSTCSTLLVCSKGSAGTMVQMCRYTRRLVKAKEP